MFGSLAVQRSAASPTYSRFLLARSAELVGTHGLAAAFEIEVPLIVIEPWSEPARASCRAPGLLCVILPVTLTESVATDALP